MRSCSAWRKPFRSVRSTSSRRTTPTRTCEDQFSAEEYAEPEARGWSSRSRSREPVQIAVAEPEVEAEVEIEEDDGRMKAADLIAPAAQ